MSTTDHTARACKAQHDKRTALLVDGLESRICLSTIMSYTSHYEDAKDTISKLCKKGEIFLQRDPGYLEKLCVPRPKSQPKSQTADGQLHQKRVVQQAQRSAKAANVSATTKRVQR